MFRTVFVVLLIACSLAWANPFVVSGTGFDQDSAKARALDALREVEILLNRSLSIGKEEFLPLRDGHVLCMLHANMPGEVIKVWGRGISPQEARVKAVEKAQELKVNYQIIEEKFDSPGDPHTPWLCTLTLLVEVEGQIVSVNGTGGTPNEAREAAFAKAKELGNHTVLQQTLTGQSSFWSCTLKVMVRDSLRSDRSEWSKTLRFFADENGQFQDAQSFFPPPPFLADRSEIVAIQVNTDIAELELGIDFGHTFAGAVKKDQKYEFHSSQQKSLRVPSRIWYKIAAKGSATKDGLVSITLFFVEN